MSYPDVSKPGRTTAQLNNQPGYQQPSAPGGPAPDQQQYYPSQPPPPYTTGQQQFGVPQQPPQQQQQYNTVPFNYPQPQPPQQQHQYYAQQPPQQQQQQYAPTPQGPAPRAQYVKGGKPWRDEQGQIHCKKCGEVYNLLPGMTSWRCRQCTEFNSLQGNQCAIQ